MGWKDLEISDFSAFHSPVNGDANQHLIFGNIPIAAPGKDLSPPLAEFLGRWEGFANIPPAKNDNKAVLVIQEITNQGGRGFVWAGSLLQYPYWVKQFQFRVVPGAVPSIEWEGDLFGGPNASSGKVTFVLSLDRDKKILQGGIKNGPDAKLRVPIELNRRESYYVYKDYPKWFASKGVSALDYRNPNLNQYGSGYVLYLPPEYKTQPQRAFPMIVFLCGTGERGSSMFLLAKHGPLRVVLEREPLPFIIVVPMLNESTAFRSFPENYLDGALSEVLADYRVDKKRIYLTGISMGGEATYRYALHRPELFAAIAPIAGFDAKYFPFGVREGFKPFTLPWERLKDVPGWVVHGADDPVVPLAAAQSTVNDWKKAGGNVRFTVLEGRDHDAWTEIYFDSEFYGWLLAHQKS